MIKKLFKIALITIIILLVSIFVSNYVITNNAKQKMFTDVQVIPKNKVGLLLGTSKYAIGGGVNLYYKYRLESAVKLYKSGKIDVILVSGDNGSARYDEPTAFKKDLIKAGIPKEKIILDYAGFRTLDSVVRAKEIFGQNTITIISQQFHNERAIYLAEHFGINAIGFNAKDVSASYGIKVTLREYLARVKVFIDIFIGKQPKFLGDKMPI